MILFYLKETSRIFCKSSIATIITITITAISVVLSAVSIFLLFNVNNLSNQMKKSIEINVYISDTLNTKNFKIIKEQLENSQSVSSVKFVDKEEAAKRFVAETGQDFSSVLNMNPLPNSFVVKFKPEPLNDGNIEGFVNQFKKIDGVTDVVYDYRTVLKILNMLKSFEFIIYILSVVLILLSIYLVYSNNKIQLFSNSNLYSSMKLVGAEIKTMKIPIIFNGVFIGFIASCICLILFNLFVALATKLYIGEKFINELSIFNLIIPVIGISLGFIGSFISSFKISRFLKTN
jgi:cell division transport system permease protein